MHNTRSVFCGAKRPMAVGLLGLAAMGCLVSVPAAAQQAFSCNAATAAAQGVPARLDHIARSFEQRGLFSGTVLVACGDALLLNQGYGLASQEWRVPHAPDVKFLLASLTKQFTAAAVLRLVDQGQLQLDDPVRQHLPQLPAAWQAITVRHLLAHSSGIPNHTAAGDFEQIKTRAMTPDALLATFKDQPLNFAPGSAVRYSNSGYIVLGLLIEKLSGKSYASFLQSELLGPLGMADSGVASNEMITPRLATGYAKDGPRLRPASFLHLSVPYSAGALYGSTGDLLKWQRGLYGGAVLSAASLKAMTTATHAESANALGLFVGRSATGQIYFHSGGINGFSTFLQYEPASRVSIVVLSNVEGALTQDLTNKLSAVTNGRAVRLPDERKPIALPEPSLARYEGSYQRSPELTAWVRRRGAQLWVRVGQEAWTLIRPESEQAFYAPAGDKDLLFEFAPGAAPTAAGSDQGLAQALVLGDSADAGRWRRVALPWPTLAAQPLYLRGSMNEWAASQVFVVGADGIHHLTVDLAAAAHQLKIATEDWATVDLGQAADDKPLLGQGRMTLVGTGGNITLKLHAPSRCVFRVDGRDLIEPVLEVRCTAR